MAVEILGEGFINLQEDGDAEERMKAAIDQANSAIFQMSNELAQLSTMATTIVAVHINGNVATIGHVGDSRLYRLDNDGNLFRETQDHSVVEEEVRAGRMTPEQALTHPSRNVISRALGAEQTVEIDMKTIMFEPNTKFLVCSDGVTRHVPDDELRTLLMEDNDSALTCNTIKELCYQRGAEDNLTAVIVSIAEAASVEFIDGAETISDYEEDTIATPRAALVNTAVFANANAESGEIPTGGLSISDQVSDEVLPKTENLIDEDEIKIPTREEGSNDRISISNEAEEQHLSNEAKAKKDIKSFRVDENGGGSIVGSIISGILWLLVGAVIGALGYHFWNETNNPNEIVSPISQTAPMTNDIFEKNKRLAVIEPTEYIANNVNPTSAYDNYLLALAFIATDNFESAKKELDKAERALADLPVGDREVLKNDISLASIKVNNSINSKNTEKTVGEENKNTKAEPSDGLQPEATGESIEDAPIGNDG